MKRITKLTKHCSLALASVLSLSVLLPVTVAAEGTSSTSPEKRTEKKEKNTNTAFCSVLDKNSQKITGEVTGAGDKLKTARENRDKKIKTEADNWATKVAEFRTAEDKKKEEHFKALDTKATTDVQKAAVTTYKDSVNLAIQTRRDAHDAARKAFQDGVKTVIASHKTTVDTDRTDFKNAVSAAFTKAKASCAAGTDAKTIQSQLQTDLKAAREAYKTDRKTDTTVGEQIKKLNETRKTTDKTTNDTFHESMKKARETLKKAFTDQNV